MWDAFFARRNFYTKCKSALRMINMRMEIITKKRSAMQNFLKNDVAELLRSNLEQNAYARAEVVYMEMNVAWCYNYVQECCKLITDNLKLMENETECPEQCKVAVASVCYAAARFADLPELRDLRSLFNDKYGNALDPYVNKELVEKLKANPPSRETKIQVMNDIAEEYSISWNPASFQQTNAYERTPSYNNNHNDKEAADQTRPNYTVSPSPYVKLKSTNSTNGNGDRDGQERHVVKQETTEMDRLLRHHSMMTWMRTTRADPTPSTTSGSTWPHGRSVSMPTNTNTNSNTNTNTNDTNNHVHPKLPQYDELANRIRALRQI